MLRNDRLGTKLIFVNIFLARWLLYGLLHQNPSDRPTAAEILKSHWLQVDIYHRQKCFNLFILF